MSGYAEYMPVQRIAQACQQCRRKKCRCTGERPICAHCRRSGQDCTYADVDAQRRYSRPRDGDEYGSNALDNSSNITGRLDALEHKLDSFGSQLSRIETLLSSVLDLNDAGAARGSNHPTNPPAGTASHGPNNLPEQEDLTVEDASFPKDVLIAVFDAYFAFCHNQPYSFFHEGNLRRRLAEQKLPAHLTLSIMAFAARFCPHPYFSSCSSDVSIDYANRAWKLIVSNCLTAGKAAELPTVQSIALLGLFDFTAGRSRHESAWVKVGIAARIAQDCGLMLESATHLPYAEQEERRRVFWSVYLLDRIVSCGRGRPPAIVDASCHLQLPCDESIWKNGLWSKTQSLDDITNRTLSAPQRPGTFAQVIAMAHILGRSAQYMLQEFNIRSPHPPWDPSSDFAALESDLLHLEGIMEMHRPLKELLAPHITPEGGVDSHNTGPIIFSRALFHLCYCLLNHPFLIRRRINLCRSRAPLNFINRSSEIGWLHAQRMMELINDARKLGCSFHSSVSGYCATVAGSIIALRTYDDDPGVSEEAQGLFAETLSYLDDVGRYWKNVSSMAPILRRMLYDGFLVSNLYNSESQIADLPSGEAEIMWEVVDYSTMSDGATGDVAANDEAAVNTWSSSWMGLFEGMDDSVPIDFSL